MFLWLLSFLWIVGRPRREKKLEAHKGTCGAPIRPGDDARILAVGQSDRGVAAPGGKGPHNLSEKQNHRPVHLKVHQSERPETAADGKREGEDGDGWLRWANQVGCGCAWR
jgi:hypothetical protein